MCIIITKDVLRNSIIELNKEFASKQFKGWETTFCQKCLIDLPEYGTYCIKCNRDENIKEILE